MTVTDFKKLYFTINGRINRKTYWLYFYIPCLLLMILFDYIKNIYGEDVGPILVLALLPIIAALISGWIKRQHDLGQSGWWVLLTAIPFVNFVYSVIYLGIVKGDVNENKYGMPQEDLNAKT